MKDMSKAFLVVQMAGKIERGIPFPVGQKKSLYAEQKKLLRLKEGECHVVAVHFGPFRTDNAERLMHWARSKGVHTVRHELDANSVEIRRVVAPQP